MTTGTDEATLPTSLSSCIIFLIRAYSQMKVFSITRPISKSAHLQNKTHLQQERLTQTSSFSVA